MLQSYKEVRVHLIFLGRIAQNVLSFEGFKQEIQKCDELRGFLYSHSTSPEKSAAWIDVTQFFHETIFRRERSDTMCGTPAYEPPK